MSKTTARKIKMTIFAIGAEINVKTDESKPQMIAATNVPPELPIPPITITTKLKTIGSKPMSERIPFPGPATNPPTPPRATPSPKTMLNVLRILMPRTLTISLSEIPASIINPVSLFYSEKAIPREKKTA
jgi:hypothetical protein